MGVAFAPRPRSLPQARLWSPPDGTTDVLILAPYIGTWVHWVGKRSLPCLNSNCPASRHRRPCKWSGYLPILLAAQKGPETAVVTITPEKASDIDEALSKRSTPIMKVVRRKGAKDWLIKSFHEAKLTQELPEVPDVQLVLCRVWGIRPDELEGGENE